MTDRRTRPVGLCHHCHGAPAAGGRTRCDPCAEARRELEHWARADRRARHLCVTCGARAAAGRRYCPSHLAYYRARAH